MKKINIKLQEGQCCGEGDEAKMHRTSLMKTMKYSEELLNMIQDSDDLPEWVESKITKASDYLSVVKHYLDGDIARSMGQLEEEVTTLEPDDPILQPPPPLGPKPKKKNANTFGAKIGKKGKSVYATAKIPFQEEVTDSEEEQLKKIKIQLKKASDMHKKQSEKIDDIVDESLCEVNTYYNLYEAVQDAVTEENESACPQCLYEILSDAACGCPDLLPEAKYQGREVTLNKPTRGDVKKFKVYVRDPKTGNIKKVNFGDKNMRIKKSNPKRRKSFRARHNCDNPGPKTKARYWSCRMWE